MALIPVTEASLRTAMRDPRYWRSGHPERQAFADWVGESFRALDAGAQGGSGDGVVAVRAYTRTRGGKPEQVGAHLRSGGSRGDGGDRPQAPASAAAGKADDASAAQAEHAGEAIPAMGRRPRPQDLERLKDEVKRWLDRRGSRIDPDAPGQAPRVEPYLPRQVSRVLPDHQGKHVEGHRNQIPGRGILRADPDNLMHRFAGRGQAVRGTPPAAGSREVFDTGDEVIGIWRDRAGNSAPTTRGTIHYSGRGAHIVPAQPRGWRR